MRPAQIIQAIEKKLTEGVQHPEFRAGDTVIVYVKVREGERERIQAYQGVVISRRNRGYQSSFTVRKISFNEGVERNFHLYSQYIDRIEVVRCGKVRRAKLYYLRELKGREARIPERILHKKDSLKAAGAKKKSSKKSKKDTPKKDAD